MPNAIADKPDNVNNPYVKPILKKKGKPLLWIKRISRLYSITNRRIAQPKPKRKNNCSKLDIPPSLSKVENIRMKLKPKVAKRM